MNGSYWCVFTSEARGAYAAGRVEALSGGLQTVSCDTPAWGARYPAVHAGLPADVLAGHVELLKMTGSTPNTLEGGVSSSLLLSSLELSDTHVYEP